MKFSGKLKKQQAIVLAPQWLKQVGESVDLINHTKNPSVFFSRYDFMIETLENLASVQHLVKFKGTAPSIYLQKYKDPRCRDEQTELFIKRSYESAAEGADKLKTQKGKDNRLCKYFESFSPYQGYLSNENYQLLLELRNRHPQLTD